MTAADLRSHHLSTAVRRLSAPFEFAEAAHDC
jgi:hypothetical protein